MLRGAHASRVFGERVLAIANFRCALFTVQEKRHLKQRLFWRNAKTSTRDACAPQNRIARWAACHAVALCEGGFGVGRWMFSASLQLAMALHLIPQPLLVAMRPHPFAALVLGNFCLSSFFKRAHSDFQTSQVAIQPFNAQYCNCNWQGHRAPMVCL